MKKLLITVIGCLMVAMATAQVSPEDALGDYEARFTRLNKAYAKEPDNVENLFNMAQFYFDNSHPMRNLPMAMKYIQRAEARHIVLLEEDRIGELTRLARKNITLTTIRQTKQAISDAAYNTLEVRTDMSRVELDTYLDAFGIDIELVRLLRQRRINQVYDEDLRKGTAESYYHFIDIYPGTHEAEQMEERLSRLASSLFEGIGTEAGVDTVAAKFPLSPSVQRAAEKQKSRLAYADASGRNTIAAYNDFLRRYPSCDEHLQAREKLATLLEVKYNSLRTPREYADFVDSNADNDLADKALAQLRRLVYEEHSIEAARLYLSRFKLDQYYNDVYNRYYSWHAEEGNSAPIRAFSKQNPDFPFPRAVEADLQRAEKIDRINLMEDFIDVDYQKYANYVRQMTGKRIAFVPLQRMIQSQLTLHNYKGALDRVRQFEICFDKESHKEYEELKNILASPATGRKPAPVLTATYNIQNPSYNVAENRMYYTRVNGPSRRICYAVKEGASWRPAGDARFSNTDNEGLTIYGFYADGKRMLLGSVGDIWIAEKEGDEWRVTDMPPYPVNSDYIETDAYMLPDGSGMLLASDRPNGHNLQPSGAIFHGDTALASDLYFIPYTQNGWGTPVNLGKDINTPYCERSPILSRNLKTLYFITDSRGLGYGDIYVATRTSVEDWTHWSTPRNVGKEVNTGFNEATVSFGADEKSLILTSNCNLGRFSAYTVPATHDASNSYQSYSLDILGMEDFLFRVRVADLTQQTVTQIVEYIGEGHSVDLSIHKDKRYAVLGDAGMYFVPAVIIEPKAKAKQRLKGYTFPVLVAMDKPLPLLAVDFEPQSANLLPVGELQLQQLAQFINHNSDCAVELVINVAGRDDELCYNLSLERGRAMRSVLTSEGVDASRITVSAYGNVNTKAGDAPGVAVRFRER
jgi:hypothetical protein